MAALDPTMRIGRQIAFACGEQPAAGRVTELLRQVGLPESAVHAHAHELSGGMAQRAVIAMAIARGPRLLVADEPTAALDTSLRAQILDLLVALKDESGAVVLPHPEWALNPRLRIGVSVAEPLVVQGRISREERQARVARMLELVGLGPGFAGRYPHEVSGGQRQRIAIARALITEPRFVVFDEAVNALDVSMRTQVLNLIVDLQTEHRFAALFISHDLAATRYVAHRIAVMYGGRFVEVGAARRFHERPCHPYSRALGDEEGFRLQGVPEDLPPRGCALARRCPWSIDRCHAERPQLRPVAEGLAACQRAEEIASS